jgi:methionyl-tRNA formyltransferase
MKIVWLSANKLGYELLKEALSLDCVNVNSVITLSKDAKTVMYDKINPKLWHKFNIKVIEINKINDEIKIIKKLKPDIIIMCGWRQIISSEILKIPKYFIGFHPTLLPVGRGPAPIINSILNGFKESGLTMFHVTDGLDNGDIIGQEPFLIEENDHSSQVYEKVIFAGKKLIKKYLPLLIKEKAPRIKQDETKATVFKKPILSDNEINLDTDVETVFRKIKALSKPYNGAYLKIGNNKLKIWRAEKE